MTKNRARHLEGDPELVQKLTEQLATHASVETTLTLSFEEPWPRENDVFVFHAPGTPPLFGWVRTVHSMSMDKKKRTEVVAITIGRRLRGISPILVPNNVA